MDNEEKPNENTVGREARDRAAEVMFIKQLPQKHPTPQKKGEEEKPLRSVLDIQD